MRRAPLPIVLLALAAAPRTVIAGAPHVSFHAAPRVTITPHVSVHVPSMPPVIAPHGAIHITPKAPEVAPHGAIHVAPRTTSPPSGAAIHAGPKSTTETPHVTNRTNLKETEERPNSTRRRLPITRVAPHVPLYAGQRSMTAVRRLAPSDRKASTDTPRAILRVLVASPTGHGSALFNPGSPISERVIPTDQALFQILRHRNPEWKFLMLGKLVSKLNTPATLMTANFDGALTLNSATMGKDGRMEAVMNVRTRSMKPFPKPRTYISAREKMKLVPDQAMEKIVQNQNGIGSVLVYYFTLSPGSLARGRR